MYPVSKTSRWSWWNTKWLDYETFRLLAGESARSAQKERARERKGEEIWVPLVQKIDMDLLEGRRLVQTNRRSSQSKSQFSCRNAEKKTLWICLLVWASSGHLLSQILKPCAEFKPSQKWIIPSLGSAHSYVRFQKPNRSSAKGARHSWATWHGKITKCLQSPIRWWF